MEFRNRLKLLREEKLLTQKEIADFLGVNYNTVGNYERGSRQPDLNTAKKLADYFKISTDYLLGRSDVRQYGEVVAASSDTPYDELPPEAIVQLEEYKQFLIEKYGKKKP